MASTKEPVPVEHLDFAYVNSCSNAKELERILKVLRSGKEGHYPDLAAATESQLSKYNPKSLLLRKDQHATSVTDLPPEERQNLLSDLDSWSRAMSSQESTRRDDVSHEPTIAIPIRGQSQAKLNGNGTAQDHVEKAALEADQPSAGAAGSASTKTAERIKAYDYRAWDKFNPDEEESGESMIEKADTEVTREADELARQTDEERIAKVAVKRGLPPAVSNQGKSTLELEHLSRIEKEKGNEAYRAGDFEESLVFYTHSLQYHPTIASYNNRALAALKLRMYSLADQDASVVLTQEKHNVKALLRRAEARQFLWRYPEAVADVKSVLVVDPKNKLAKKMLPFLEKEARSPSTAAESAHAGQAQDNGVAGNTAPSSAESSTGSARSRAAPGQTSSAPINIPAASVPVLDVETSQDQNGDEEQGTVQEKESQQAHQSSSPQLEQGQQQHKKKKKKKKGTSIKITEVEGGTAHSPNAASPDFPAASSSPGLESPMSASGKSPPIPISPGRKGKAKKAMSFQEPPKCSPKTARTVQPISILKRTTSGHSSSEGAMSPGARRGLHWAESLISTSPSSSYNASSPGTPQSAFPMSRREAEAARKGKTSSGTFGFEDRPVSSDDGFSPMVPDAARTLGSPDASCPVSSTTSATAAASSTAVDGAVQAKLSGASKQMAPQTPPQTVGQPSDANAPSTPARQRGSEQSSASPAESVQPPASLELAQPSAATKPEATVEKPLPAPVQKLKDVGNGQFKAGDYQTAKDTYTKAIDKLGTAPENAFGRSTLLNNRAACHSKLGDCSACIDDCTQVLDVQTNNAKAWMRRGDAFQVKERFADAYADYQQVVVIDPSNCSNAQNAMTSLVTYLQYEHGTRWRSKLPSRPTVVPLSHTATTKQAAGEQREVKSSPAISTGHPSTSTTATTNEAKATAPPAGIDTADLKQKTTQLPAELYETVKQRGNDFVKKGEWAEAIYCYSSCVATDPSNPAAFCNRALCHLKLNKPNEAELDCLAALRLDPKLVKALYRKALAEKEQHRYSDCLKSLRQVIELDRSNVAALKEVQKVGKLAKEAGQIPESFKRMSDSPAAAAASGSASSKATASSAAAWSKSPAADPVQQQASPVFPTATTAGRKKKKKKKGGAGAAAATMPSPADTDRERRKLIVKQVDHDSDEDMPKADVATRPSPQAAAPAATPPTTAAAATTASHAPKDSVDAAPPSGAPKKSSKSAGRSKKTSPPTTTPSASLLGSSPYQFLQAWSSVKSGDKLLQYYHLLLQIQPEKLPQLIGNKCDGDMLMNIIYVVRDHYLPSRDHDLAYQVLSALPKVDRFQTCAMFMTVGEKIEINKVIQDMSLVDCPTYSREDLDRVTTEFLL